jgi:hypothetical protein
MLYCQEERATKPVELDAYQRQARTSDQNRRTGAKGIRGPLLGLYGEAGSLLTQLKRTQREKATFTPYYASVVEEMGDVLWYLSNLASRYRVALSALATTPPDGPNAPAFVARSGLTFGNLQKKRKTWKSKVTLESEEAFFAFGGVVGKLMSEFASGDHHGLDRHEFIIRLARTLQLLIRAANITGVSLTLVAHNNLAKIRSRWPAKKKKKYLELFDADNEQDEQIPRRIVMYFVERKINKKLYVYQLCRGINIGDRLTDNKEKKDDYRFHDVFHLAYAAVLGWSPVTRALFQVKRKRDPDTDENQDGARAILIEEGIATWIFNHGTSNKDFRDTKNLDYSLLKAIRQLVSDYEVEDCPLWQWEMAILEGFKVFRKLKKHRRGWVVADLRKRSIAFRHTQPAEL